jgi:hypothetical protein
MDQRDVPAIIDDRPLKKARHMASGHIYVTPEPVEGDRCSPQPAQIISPVPQVPIWGTQHQVV